MSEPSHTGIMSVRICICRTEALSVHTYIHTYVHMCTVHTFVDCARVSCVCACVHVYIKYFTLTSESILMSKYEAESINHSIATDCRTFRPRRPSSTAYKTVLYAVDKGLCGRNVLQPVV